MASVRLTREGQSLLDQWAARMDDQAEIETILSEAEMEMLDESIAAELGIDPSWMWTLPTEYRDL